MIFQRRIAEVRLCPLVAVPLQRHCDYTPEIAAPPSRCATSGKDPTSPLLFAIQVAFRGPPPSRVLPKDLSGRCRENPGQLERCFFNPFHVELKGMQMRRPGTHVPCERIHVNNLNVHRNGATGAALVTERYLDNKVYSSRYITLPALCKVHTCNDTRGWANEWPHRGRTR